MGNINVGKMLRDMSDTVGDLIAAASDIDSGNAAAKMAKVEQLSALIYAHSVQAQAQIASGIAAGLAILHYGPLIEAARAEAAAPPAPRHADDDATRKRARTRRRASAASVSAPRKPRGSRRAPSR